MSYRFYILCFIAVILLMLPAHDWKPLAYASGLLLIIAGTWEGIEIVQTMVGK